MQAQVRPVHEWHTIHSSQAFGRGGFGAGSVGGEGRRGEAMEEGTNGKRTQR